MWTRLAAIAPLAALALGLAFAAGARAARPAAVSPADRDFMRAAAQGGMAEVELGRLAMTLAVEGDVRDFAERMISDHSRANQSLTRLASRRGVRLPESLSGKDQRLRAHLSSLTGEEFDRAYMRAMVRGHAEVASAFERELDQAQDPALRRWVRDFLPTIHHHLHMAEETARRIHAGGMAASP